MKTIVFTLLLITNMGMVLADGESKKEDNLSFVHKNGNILSLRDKISELEDLWGTPVIISNINDSGVEYKFNGFSIYSYEGDEDIYGICVTTDLFSYKSISVGESKVQIESYFPDISSLEVDGKDILYFDLFDFEKLFPCTLNFVCENGNLIMIDIFYSE